LLHRAVKEGEDDADPRANRKRTKGQAHAADPGPADHGRKLPQQLQDLIARPMTLLNQGSVALDTTTMPR